MRKAALCLMIAGLSLSVPLSFAAEPAQKGQSNDKSAIAGGGGGIEFAKSNTPLDVTADQGIEFSQDSKEVIAHVNARAVRGNSTVLGDTLTAYYRPKVKAVPTSNAAPTPAAVPAKQAPADPSKPASGDETSASEVWRVVADGNVEIFTPTQHAYGDHADYNIDDAAVVMTGDHLKMTTPLDIVTARDSLEYWEGKHQAVARGNAVAVRAEKRLQADTLVADFAENAQKQTVIQVAHGYDHVVLTTATDVVTGDRADYVVETGIVTVTGSVKLTRQNNQLNGGYAVVNLNTGISQLFPAPPGGKAGDRQVKGLFTPQKKAEPPPAKPVPKGP